MPTETLILWPRPCQEEMMPVRIAAITMACRDARRPRAVWTGALGYEVAGDHPSAWMGCRDPSGTNTGLGLQVVPAPTVGTQRVHLDLVPSEGQLETEIRRLEHLGAKRVRDVEHDPDAAHRIMADPEDHAFCGVRPPWELRPARPEG